MSSKSRSNLFTVVLIAAGILIVFYLLSQALTPKPVEMPKFFTPAVQSTIPSEPITLYNFSSKKCPYSIRFDPTWKALQTHYQSIPNLILKEVDVSDPQYERLVFYYKVEDTPTIIMASASASHRYVGSRDFASMKAFVTDATRPKTQ